MSTSRPPPAPSMNPPTSLLASPVVQLSILVSLGTIYSIIYGTALDTSNPLSNLPIRHDGQTAYLAQKSNVFNQIFVKRAWGWTSAAFLAVFLTAPPKIARPSRRLARWAATTAVWLVFASWFFGPSLFDRITSWSGGQCVVHVPVSSTSTPDYSHSSPSFLTVPDEFCRSHSVITPAALQSHPEVLLALSSALSSAIAGTSAVHTADTIELETLKLRPKLYRGHDVSGHLFLLSLSILFLVDQLRPSFRFLPWFKSTPVGISAGPRLSSSTEPSASEYRVERDDVPLTAAHQYAVLAAGGLVALWVVMSVATSVYFHTPLEKLSGFAIGVGGYYASKFIAP